MPKKLIVREFEENGFYHILNRGNNKQVIFRETEDLDYFLELIKIYTTPAKKKTGRNFYQQIEIISYCLMSNHFHILLHQIPKQAFSEFMHCISVQYTRYFNIKYNHVGHLFQGTFQARHIENSEDLLNVSKYIHNNAKDICKDILRYKYSSAAVYVGKREKSEWLYTQYIFDILEGNFGVEKNKLFSTYKKYFLN